MSIRNVRNFWVEAEIDGRETDFASGPRAKDGGIEVTIKQRNEGEVVEALRISGFAQKDGTLVLRVSSQGHTLTRIVSHRDDLTLVKGYAGVPDVDILR